MFRYFARRWPDIVRVRHPPPGDTPVVARVPIEVTDAEIRGGAARPVAELCIDFNSIVHMCARSVPEGAHGFEDAVIAASLRHLGRLVDIIQPRKLVHVAVDGVPPRAKMVQQRARRYIGVHRAERLRSWDTNAITPGTAFMGRMCKALAEWGAGSRTISTIVSGDGEQGEGEQKIFQRIRARGSYQADEGAVVVYSLDADIMLMALALPRELRSLVRIVREQDIGGCLQVVSVAEIARHVLSDLRRACGPAAMECDDDDRLADYVAALGLLGNDFVPSLPGFRICSGAVEAVVRAYAAAVIALPGQRLAKGGPDALGGMDPRVLGHMVSSLADEEASAVERTERDLDAAASRTQSFRAAPARAELHDSHPLSACKPVSLMAGSGWRIRYHQHVFGVYSPESAQRAASSYILSLAWSSSYMRQTCLSQGHYYPHTHAPTALDLTNALCISGPRASLAMAKSAEQAFESADRAHATPVEQGLVDAATWQLMMVLPPQSSSLIPNAVARRVVSGQVHSVSYMFPVAFRIATYGREKLHECSPMLPGLDIDLLVDALMGEAA